MRTYTLGQISSFIVSVLLVVIFIVFATLTVQGYELLDKRSEPTKESIAKEWCDSNKGSSYLTSSFRFDIGCVIPVLKGKNIVSGETRISFKTNILDYDTGETEVIAQPVLSIRDFIETGHHEPPSFKIGTFITKGVDE